MKGRVLCRWMVLSPAGGWRGGSVCGDLPGARGMRKKSLREEVEGREVGGGGVAARVLEKKEWGALFHFVI